TNQVRNFAQVTIAIANGDLSHKVTVGTDGEMQEWKETVNVMVDQLNAFAGELIRVSHEVVDDGRAGSWMQVPGTSGVWQKQIESVNALAAKAQPAAP
ncbi:MAG: HAMP domain-containing protein, partial [Fibrella sp.]|nr:HAMP domain-containing protein [Armatimonadota bacterium]